MSFLKSSRFSVRTLVVFVIIFAGIGTYLLFSSLAATTPLATLQAEQMALPAGASIVSDSSASGGQAVKMTQKGSLTGTVTLPSTATSLSVVARSSSCKNNSVINVKVDNQAVIPQTTIRSTTWQTISSPAISLTAATHKVQITFDNPNTNCNHILYVDVTNFYGPTTPPPAPTVTISATPNQLTVGQSSTLTWSSTNASSCTASGAWSGPEPTSGSVTTGALNATSTYNLACTGGGGTATGAATVTVGSGGTGGVPGAFKYWGVHLHQIPPSESYTDLATDMANAQQVHANMVRVPINWGEVEYSGKGVYDSAHVAGIDKLMSTARAENIKVIATIAVTPRWASTGGVWNDAPTNPQNMGDFANWLATRYKGLDPGTLAAIEVWNEPEINNNLLTTTGAVSSNLPSLYTSLDKAVYTSTKAADPSVTVVAGALSYADTNFLNGMYASGIKGYYDRISIHPYADQATPASCYTHSFACGIETMHNDQVANGDNSPLWITEFGNFMGTSSGNVSPDTAGCYDAWSYDLLFGEKFVDKSGVSTTIAPYVEAGVLYQLRDQSYNLTNPEANFGLLDVNHNFKTTFGHVQNELNTAPAVRNITSSTSSC